MNDEERRKLSETNARLNTFLLGPTKRKRGPSKYELFMAEKKRRLREKWRRSQDKETNR
jgi:hypothetical protein